MAVIPKAGEVFHSDDGTVSVVLPDVCDTNFDPTEEDLREYAEYLGVDLEKEPHLSWIVRKGMQTPLPMGWKACRTGEDEVYYFNFCTGESSWENPLDDVFKRNIEEERSKMEKNEGKSNILARSSAGSSQSSSRSSLSSTSSTAKKGRGQATGDLRIEKGAAGYIDSTDGRRKSTLSTPASSSSSAPTRFMPSGAMGVPLSNMRFGRLGALGTPEATRRITPDVSSLLALSKGDSACTRVGRGSGSGGGGLGGGVLGKQTKGPDGVRDMEAQICQRIDSDIEARRRAMHLRNENILAEERVALDAALHKAAEEGRRELLERQKEQEGVTRRMAQAKLEAVQHELEQQHAEAKERVSALCEKLKREREMGDTVLQQLVVAAREKLRKDHAEVVRAHREASAAALSKERERLSEEHARELDEDMQKSKCYARASNEGLQKKHAAVRAQVEKQLAEKRSAAAAAAAAAATDARNDKVAMAKRVYEAAIQQASSEAASTLDTLRMEYSQKVEDLLSKKKKALRVAGETAVAASPGDADAADALKMQKEQREQVLKRELEEKVARYTEETQRLVAARREELSMLSRQRPSSTAGGKSSSSATCHGGGGGGGAAAAAPALRSPMKEQQRFELASRNLEASHTRTMDQILKDHENLLLERQLFNPRKSPEYLKKLEELQNSWIKEHPDPNWTMPVLEPVPTVIRLLDTPPVPIPSEAEQQECIDVAVAAAREKKTREFERQLEDARAALAKEMQVAVDAYREERHKEVQVGLSQYKEAHAAHHQRRLEDAAAAIAVEQTTVVAEPQMLPLRVEEEVTVEEATRCENEMRQRLQEGISSLQAERDRAHAQLCQLRDEAKVKCAAAQQRPPPAPMVASHFGQQEQQLAPRAFQPHHQSHYPPHPHPQYGSSTPVLSSAWSTILPSNSLRSSAQASPGAKFHCIDAIGSTATEAPCRDEDGVPLQDRLVMTQTSGTMFLERDILFKDRLRRAALLLQERKSELRAQQVRMVRARKEWLQDIEDCRNRRDHEKAVMLRQIKLALEDKARQLNQEVLDLKQVSAWLRGREAQYKQHPLSHMDTHPAVGNDVNATVAADGAAQGSGSTHLIRLLEGILANTAVLESPIRSSRQRDEARRIRRHGSPSARAKHSRLHDRHVGKLTLRSSANPGRVARWLDDQQPH